MVTYLSRKVFESGEIFGNDSLLFMFLRKSHGKYSGDTCKNEIISVGVFSKWKYKKLRYVCN